MICLSVRGSDGGAAVSGGASEDVSGGAVPSAGESPAPDAAGAFDGSDAQEQRAKKNAKTRT
jgi:hypothetical protein